MLIKNNDFRVNVGGTALMRLQWPVLLSEMSLEYSHGDTRQSNPELGHGTKAGVSRRGAASDAVGGPFCTASGGIEPKAIHFGPRFVAGEGE